MTHTGTLPYTVYAEIYDEFKGSRQQDITIVQNAVAAHNPDSVDILDIACGTGALAAALQAQGYMVTGVDSSSAMCAIAKHRLGVATVCQADMRSFDLGKQFDTAYCLHNSMNHLLDETAWHQMLTTLTRHLRPHGIFVCDINTHERLRSLAAMPLPVPRKIRDYMVTTVVVERPVEKRYSWLVRMQSATSNQVWEEDIPIQGVWIGDAIAVLSGHVTVLDHFTVLDGSCSVPKDYVICRL